MSGFKVEFSVLNLKATPGIYADAFANRPAAGYPGRVFIDTDNPSTGMYRDTGTVWVQIAETATSDVDTLQNVTDNGNTTTNSISVGHASTPVAIIDARTPFTNLNNADSFCIAANTSRNITSNASFGVNYVNTVYGFQSLVFNGNATIGNGGINSAGNFINFLNNNTTGTVSVTQAATIRAIAGTQTGIYYNTGAASTVFTHVAAFKTLQPINTGSLPALVTNNYGLLVADNTASSGTITYTNRWGIYQEGASDKNYFAANVLIKSTTDNGNALQVTGDGNITGNLGLGVSPSNWWGGVSVYELPRGVSFFANKSVSASSMVTNAIFNTSTTWEYKTNAQASRYDQYQGRHEWYTAPTGTAGNAISFTQAMTLTSGGELLINTTTDVGDFKLQVNGNGYFTGNINANFYSANNAAIVGWGTGTAQFAPNNYWQTLQLYTNGTQRLTINSSGSVGINTTSPNASALVEMTSTTQGLLIPRMTTTERDNIVSPAIGLLIFNTTTNRLNIYDGAWIAVH